MQTNVTKESFVEELANTLTYLYDPGVLRRTLLLSLFDLDQKSNSIANLQSILTKAIDALKPNESVPHGTNAWQIYHILYYRYVEQFIQREVAKDLGLSTRQLRRKEKIALQVLADYLWSQYHLEKRLKSLTPSKRTTDSVENNWLEIETLQDPDMQTQTQELEWLQKTIPSESVDLQELVEGIVDTLQPLARSLGVDVKCKIPSSCPPLNLQMMTIRQALIYIITTAIRIIPQGQVIINAETYIGQTNVCLHIKSQRGDSSLVDANRGKELNFAQKLLQMSQSLLNATIDPDATTPFKAKVILPTAKKIPILVIDDNPDLLGLVQRYLSSTRYEFHGTSDSHVALNLAEQLAPEIILLDVMLPGLDGWELVGRLREHPKTSRSSIVICTILPQEQLALTLGASDFIRKPIRRKELLAVLDRQMNQLLKDVSPSVL